MDISYLFPIFENNDAKTFFNKFLSSKFFLEHKNVQVLTFVAKDDEKNVKFLLKLSEKNKIFKVVVEEQKFSYNDAFKKAIQISKGDILLLGDAKISNIDTLFSKCVEKYNSKADIVFVKKKYGKIKNFFYNALQCFYNFFIKIFTGKKDRFNIVSLGLYNKDVVELFRELPSKCCFLKNTKNLFGFCSKTIYIDSKIDTLRLNFTKKTNSLFVAIISLSLFIILLLLTIFLNIFLNEVSIVYNIFAIFGCFILFMMASLLFPKHFYDIRNEVKN